MIWENEAEWRLEWEIANQYLKINSHQFRMDGTKIKRGNHQDLVNKKTVNLTHSFIVFSGKIFAIGDKENYIKKQTKGGLKARIKFCTDEEKIFYGLKIQISHGSHLSSVLSENQIAVDQGVALPGGCRKIAENIWKCYSPYFYFHRGTLQHYLLKRKPALSDKATLWLAFMVTDTLDKLHTGDSSLSAQPYAHLDIKPGNMVFDNSFALRFIDFGFSDALQGQATKFHGTEGYLPLHPLSYSKQNLDIFALLRVFYLPKKGKTHDLSNRSHMIKWDFRYKDDSWIFHDDFIAQTPRLKALIDRADNRDELLTLDTHHIMKVLTLLRCELDDSYNDYLSTKIAIHVTNYLYDYNIIPIKKEYLDPKILKKVYHWQAIEKNDLEKLIADEQKKKALAQVDFVASKAKNYPIDCFFKQTEQKQPSMHCIRTDFRPFLNM